MKWKGYFCIVRPVELTAEQHQVLRDCTKGETELRQVLSLFNEITAAPPRPDRLIMVVDDDEGVVNFVKKILEARGYETLTTCSPRVALSLLRYKSPDLILLDISMPELDGSELFARIREMPHTKRTPVIFMTGLINPAEENDFNHARDGLRRHYLGKPFTSDKLISAITAMIGA